MFVVQNVNSHTCLKSYCIIYLQISREHGVPFLETSAKANINVEKAFMDLAQAILNKVRSSTHLLHIQNNVKKKIHLTGVYPILATGETGSSAFIL